MAVTLATTSIAYSIGSLFAQSEETINENTLIDVEEVKEENIETEGLETVVEETLESEEDTYNVEKATGDVAINEVNFPDSLFRNLISRDFDKDSDGILSSGEIAKITKINISPNGWTNIASVEGIEHFPNLTFLSCINAYITSIDVSKNIALKILNCRNTKITELDISKNLALDHLDVSRTKITALDISRNLELRNLDVSGSGIRGLDVKNHSKLDYLCANADLAWLDIGYKPNLTIERYDGFQDYNNIDLGVVEENTFNIKERFPGIDLNKITITGGASLDKNTGIVSGYKPSDETGRKFILSYEYSSGTAKYIQDILDISKPKEIEVIIKTKLYVQGKSSLTINDGLDKVYDGTAVLEPTVTKTGSTGTVSFEWYTADGTLLQTAPTDAGSYKVKAILAAYGNYGSAEAEKAFTIGKAASSIIINDDLNKVYDGQAVADPTSITKIGSNGDIIFEWYQADGTKLQTAPTDAGSYKVKAILAGDTNYADAEAEKGFDITKASSTIIIHDDLNKVYDAIAVVEPTVTKTGSTGTVSFEWYTADGTLLQTAPTDAGDYKVKAILAEDANHIGAEVEETFSIAKASSTITIDDDLNKIYDGVAVVEPSITKTGSTGTVTFEWYMADGTKLAKAPVNAGSYKVKAILEDDVNHIGTEVEKEFTIGKASSMITINDNLNKTYDGTEVVEPTDIITTGSTGTVSIEWYTADGTKLETAAVNAGSYKVKAILAEDANYAGVEVEKEFTISQAASSVTITTELDKVYDGKPVVEPQVSVTGSTGAITYEWYKKEESTTRAVTWTLLTEVPREVGNYKVVVTVAEDGNFEAVTVEKEFSISEQVIVVPTPGLGGVITNPDGTEGSVVNPDDKVESNGPVITNPDGSITFPNGGTITRPDGSVVIIQSGAILKPNEESTIIPGQSVTGVQTGDRTQVGLWTMLVGLSTGMMMYFRKKNSKEGV